MFLIYTSSNFSGGLILQSIYLADVVIDLQSQITALKTLVQGGTGTSTTADAQAFNNL